MKVEVIDTSQRVVHGDPNSSDPYSGDDGILGSENMFQHVCSLSRIRDSGNESSQINTRIAFFSMADETECFMGDVVLKRILFLP